MCPEDEKLECVLAWCPGRANTSSPVVADMLNKTTLTFVDVKSPLSCLNPLMCSMFYSVIITICARTTLDKFDNISRKTVDMTLSFLCQ